MTRFKIIVAYDGTEYCGFARQRQANTIQQTLETAISKIVRHDVIIHGAGRTDAGVHAQGQCCIFDSETKIPPEKLILAINSHLPKDIAVKSLEVVDESFHPRFGAKRKTYRYQIYNSRIRDPFLCKYCYQYKGEINIERMQEAAKEIVGEHDFACFCASGSTVKGSMVRTVYDIHIKKENNLVTVDISGNGFLYNMVRIIVGTLLYVSEGKLSAQDVRHIIESKDRTKAGPTAPAEGLTMLQIIYE